MLRQFGGRFLIRFFYYLFVFLFLQTSVLFSQSFPILMGDSLSGDRLSLPLKGHVQVLILGFDMASADPMASWQQVFQNTNILVYQVPIIGGVPPFVDGFIKNGMKKSVPKSLHAAYMPYFGNKFKVMDAVSNTGALADKVTPFIFVFNKKQKVLLQFQANVSTQNVLQVKKAISR
jgi:hypothetical protein